MGHVVDIMRWQIKKAVQIADAALLECPTCGVSCIAVQVGADGATAYRCTGNGHRALAWRIDAAGKLLHGLRGKRYYQL